MSEYVSFTNTDYSGAFTLSIWAKPMSRTSNGTLFGDTADANNDGIKLDTNGKVTMTVAGASTVLSANALDLNTWHHVAVTRDASNAIKCYVNGIDDTTGTPSISGTLGVNAVGATGSTPTDAFVGDLTDFRQYSSALSAAEVKQLATGTDVISGLTFDIKVDDTSRSVPNVAGGLSLEFDGSSDYVDVPAAVLSGGASLTYSAWVKTSTGGGVIDAILGTGRAGFYVNTTVQYSDGNAWLDSGVDVRDNSWHHIAVTINGTNAVIYVDGVSHSGSVVSRVFTATSMAIGSKYSGTTDYFDGLIDDVRIYDVALTQADITNLYNGIEPSTAPIAHWPFDDGPQGTPTVGDAIATWQSRDGSRKILSQATASKRPTYYLDSNNKAWLTHDGTDDYLKISDAVLSGTETAFFIAVDAVAQTGTHILFATSDEATATKYYAVAVVNDKITVYQYDGSTLMTLTGSTALAGGKHVIGIFSDGTTTTATLDGNAETLTGTDTGNTWGDAPDRDNLTLGALVNTAVNNPADAKLARVLAYDRQLSATEKHNVSKKLKKIYGVS